VEYQAKVDQGLFNYHSELEFIRKEQFATVPRPNQSLKLTAEAGVVSRPAKEKIS
jgi:hypothetical protein